MRIDFRTPSLQKNPQQGGWVCLKSFIGGTLRHLALRKIDLEDFTRMGVLKDALHLSMIRLRKV
jgi:hypothetical protein